MPKLFSRRPSASMVVATTALVVALSGTAIAARGLVSGDSLIAKHSLSGNRLRNGTLTGQQINVTKLGKVPSAATADIATSAAGLGGDVTVTPFAKSVNPGASTTLVTVSGSLGPHLTVSGSCDASGKAALSANADGAFEAISDVSGSPPQTAYLPTGDVMLTSGPTSTAESGTANFVTNDVRAVGSLEQDYQIEWNAWPTQSGGAGLCELAGDIISTTP